MIASWWDGWRPATCMPDACFCEAIRDGWIRQPANTWSCLAFVFVALLVLGRTFDRNPDRHPSNPLAAKRTYGVIYAAALLLIGLGSGFYHASLTFAGQFFDVFGMYLLGTFILLYSLARLRRIPEAAIAVGYLLLNAVLAVLLFTLPELRRYAFAALLAIALWLELAARRRGGGKAEGRYLWLALASIAVGFTLWTLDLTRALCDAESIAQGHAVWHVAGALSAWWLYRYYRSEREG